MSWRLPWLRIEQLIRSIGHMRWDSKTRSIAREMFKRAVEQREKIRRAGWFN